MESQVGILRNPPKVYRQRPHIKRNLLAQINLDRQMRDSDAALLRNSPETPSLPMASLQIKKKSACSNKFGQTDFFFICGKWGIRTLDTLARIPHFECGSFDHSDNFPFFCVQRYCFFLNYATKYFIFFLSYRSSKVPSE